MKTGLAFILAFSSVLGNELISWKFHNRLFSDTRALNYQSFPVLSLGTRDVNISHCLMKCVALKDCWIVTRLNNTDEGCVFIPPNKKNFYSEMSYSMDLYLKLPLSYLKEEWFKDSPINTYYVRLLKHDVRNKSKFFRPGEINSDTNDLDSSVYSILSEIQSCKIKDGFTFMLCSEDNYNCNTWYQTAKSLSSTNFDTDINIIGKTGSVLPMNFTGVEYGDNSILRAKGDPGKRYMEIGAYTGINNKIAGNEFSKYLDIHFYCLIKIEYIQNFIETGYSLDISPITNSFYEF